VLFDRYVMVDWSARAVPATGRDSIWVADLDGAGRLRLVNPPTRHAALAHLDALVRAARDERVLVGVDVTFGYPTGTARASGLRGVPWLATWRHLAASVVDLDDNRNNRFAVADAWNRRLGPGPGPFWGCPAGAATDALPVRRPSPFPADQHRACERWLRRRGLRPFTVWQLGGAGSVGGQALVGIPVLHELLARHPTVAVWPFTTGFATPALDRPGVVLAEAWPSAFVVDRAAHDVKDAAQVRSVVGALARADAAGGLAAWFEPPADVARDEIDAAASEEAWVLVPPGAE
jgi:precorrin-8X/cobalt-precorrin-8 methylmutase